MQLTKLVLCHILVVVACPYDQVSADRQPEVDLSSLFHSVEEGQEVRQHISGKEEEIADEYKRQKVTFLKDVGHFGIVSGRNTMTASVRDILRSSIDRNYHGDRPEQLTTDDVRTLNETDTLKYRSTGPTKDDVDHTRRRIITEINGGEIKKWQRRAANRREYDQRIADRSSSASQPAVTVVKYEQFSSMSPSYRSVPTNHSNVKRDDHRKTINEAIDEQRRNDVMPATRRRRRRRRRRRATFVDDMNRRRRRRHGNRTTRKRHRRVNDISDAGRHRRRGNRQRVSSSSVDRRELDQARRRRRGGQERRRRGHRYEYNNKRRLGSLIKILTTDFLVAQRRLRRSDVAIHLAVAKATQMMKNYAQLQELAAQRLHLGTAGGMSVSFPAAAKSAMNSHIAPSATIGASHASSPPPPRPQHAAAAATNRRQQQNNATVLE